MEKKRQEFILKRKMVYVDEDDRPHNFIELKKKCESCIFFDLIYGGCPLDCFNIMKKRSIIIIR